MEFLEFLGVVLGFGVAATIPIGALFLFRGWSRRIERRSDPDLELLQARLARLDEVESRLLELEERMDFSERVLASPDRGTSRGLG